MVWRGDLTKKVFISIDQKEKSDKKVNWIYDVEIFQVMLWTSSVQIWSLNVRDFNMLNMFFITGSTLVSAQYANKVEL